MTFHLEEALQILERTPRLLDAWLSGLDDAWLQTREREGAWTPLEIVAHLIHGEVEDWIPRARRILDHGESMPFTPFVRDGHVEHARGKDLRTMLDEFGSRRAENVAALRVLAPDAATLQRTGRHPALGRVTLENLLATWTAHDLAHVAQIARTLAKRYRGSAGPWAHPDYMPVFGA